jgi:hypothetical protein
VNRVVFQQKPINQDVVRTFDFTSLFTEGEVLAAAVVDVSVFSGTDASPLDMLDGTVELDGLRVSQRFTGGTLGAVYTVTCLVGTCNEQVLSLAAYLAVGKEADE